MELQSGQMLGPYRIINQVGQGGMATVYKAYQPAMDRYVAVKVLPQQLAQSAEFMARFQQEARTIARLEHAHILPVYDYGENEGYTYLVMRYLEAGTLKERLRAGAMRLGEVDRCFSQLAEALDYAHSQGVVHRDLKPANVLLDARGNVFLTDFGIAKLLESNLHLTNTGAMVGTPAYMSPEQAHGSAVDQRSDIYSLGIILYEMVVGKVPFEADTPLAIILKQVSAPLPLPSAIKPDVTPEVERVLLKALAKAPEDRFANVGDFLAAWKNTLAGANTSTAAPALKDTSAPKAPPPSLPLSSVLTRVDLPGAPGTPGAAPSAPSAPSAPGTPPSARNRWLWVAGGLLGLCALAVCGGFAITQLVNQMLPLSSSVPATATALIAEPTPDGTARPPLTAGYGTPTAWAAGNQIFAITEYQGQILAGGTGSLNFWSPAGELQQRWTPDQLGDPYVMALTTDPKDGSLWIATTYGVVHVTETESVYYNPIMQNLEAGHVSALAWTTYGLLAGSRRFNEAGAGLYRLTEAQAWERLPGFPSGAEEAASDQLSSDITAIAQAPNTPVLWVGTTNGLGRLEGETWTRFDTTAGLPSNFIYAILTTADEVWVSTYEGTVQWEAATSTFVPAPKEVAEVRWHQMLQSSTGDLWFVGEGGAAHRAAATKGWTVYPYTDFSTYTQNTVFESSTGQIYIGGEDGLLHWVDGDFDHWLVPNVPRFASYSKILTAPDGLLWFVQEYSAHADRFDVETNTWSPLANPPGEPLGFDAAGRLWAYVYEKGLLITHRAEDVAIGPDQGLPAERALRDVAFDDAGHGWLATNEGIYVCDGTTITEHYTTESVGLPDNNVHRVLRAQDGSLWVMGQHSLSRYMQGEWEHTTEWEDLSPYVEFTDIAQGPDGRLWVTTRGEGVLVYENGAWQNLRERELNVWPSDNVRAVTVAPNGDVWLSFEFEGTAWFNGQTWQRFLPADGLIYWQVNDLWADPTGGVWFATGGGLTYLPASK